MRNLPFTVFKNVYIGVSGFYFGTITAHSEFINACILCKVATNSDVTSQNHALGLFEKEAIKIVNNECRAVSWNVRNSREKYSIFAISCGNSG